MILRNINFGGALGASGVTGFFSGEEYKYHRLYKKLIPGFSFEGMTFVGKTFTFDYNKGHTKLAADGYSIAEWFPDSIKAFLRHDAFLNAVGLSNPGAEFFLQEKYEWQQRTKPFMLSFMAIGKTHDQRLMETRLFVEMLLRCKKDFKAPFALQMNYSCPNVSHLQQDLVGEVREHLDIAQRLNAPLIPKFNLLIGTEVARYIATHPACDAICVSNTIPFGQLPNDIDWKKFGGKESPLKKYGGGGLSGRPLFPLLCRWLADVDRNINFPKPILAGGGIMSAKDIVTLSKFEYVTGVSIGSGVIRYPWRVQGMIKTANHLFKNS